MNLGVREMGKLIQTSRTTISKLENNVIKIYDMILAERRNIIFHEFFRKNNIIFPTEHSIELKASNRAQKINYTDKLTRFQLKSSRIILKKTQKELAQLTNTKPSAIMYAEKLSNESYIQTKDSFSLINTFQQNNIKFPNNFSVSFKKIVDKGLLR